MAVGLKRLLEGRRLGKRAPSGRPGRARWAAVAAAVAVLGGGWMATGGPAHAAAHTAGTGALNPWALENENPNPNQVAVPLAQALRDAANFNIITAHPIDYLGDVAQMRAVNPHLILLAYQNATFAQKGQGGSLPESTYEHDRNGKRVINPGTGNQLMDPSNPTWVQTRVLQCQAFLVQSGYNGCYLDLLGLAPLSTPFVSGVPINAKTGQPWIRSDWLHATAALAATVRAAIHPALVLGNGLSNGALFFDPVSPTKQLVDAMDGGVAEAWIRGSKTPVKNFPTEALWQQNVQMLVTVEAQGKPLLTLTKLWVTATPAQHQQWYQYVLASFLMGTQGRSAFFYSDGFNIARTTPCALCNLNIGTPLGPYAKAAGVYQRPFSSGRVLVNPTPATVKVALGATFYTVAHQAVTTVTMGPDTGVILTRT